MKKLFLYLLLSEIGILLAIPCPFGSEAYTGRNYLFPWLSNAGPTFHDALDIHTNCGDSIFSIGGGTSSRNPNAVPGADPNDYEVHIGETIYGHIDWATIPLDVRLATEEGDPIPAGTYIGKAICGGPNSNWSPHIHLVFGDKNYANRNPLGILDTVYGLGCSYFNEDVTTSFVGITVIGYNDIGKADWTNGSPPIIDGGISVKIFSEFSTSLGKGREIAPYQIKWGFDNSELGTFNYNGTIPRKDWQTRATKFNQIHTEGKILDLTKMTGSIGGSYNFSSFANGYWNTLQRKTGDWQELAYPCSLDTRKFPDGPHKVWVWARTYCDTIGKADTVKVIIDNNPPQAEASKESAYVIKVEFSEPMDTSTFDGNIDIRILCHNMAQATNDSITFSEDLTELYIYMPDTFYSDEAYNVELIDNITDAAGTSLDGNANCNEDSSDSYKKIVGNGNCNLAFIVQSGGSKKKV